MWFFEFFVFKSQVFYFDLLRLFPFHPPPLSQPIPPPPFSPPSFQILTIYHLPSTNDSYPFPFPTPPKKSQSKITIPKTKAGKQCLKAIFYLKEEMNVYI